MSARRRLLLAGLLALGFLFGACRGDAEDGANYSGQAATWATQTSINGGAP